MSARGCAGSILGAPAQVLVCPTNSVGVMGAGLARAFAERHRGLLDAYRAACRAGEHGPDAPFAWAHPGGMVLCVATKRHWRDPSDITDVRGAVAAMFAWIAEHEPESVAIPALGCGLGGLSWERQVRPLIAAGAKDCRAHLLIYAPWQPPGREQPEGAIQPLCYSAGMLAAPMIAKADILLAYDPTGRAGDAAFKRLRRSGAISDGMSLPVRKGPGLSGRLVAYCALNRDAAVAARRDDWDTARALADRARQIEDGEPWRILAAFAKATSADWSARDDTAASLGALLGLSWHCRRDATTDLCRSVEAVRNACAGADPVRSILGRVCEMTDTAAWLESPDDDRWTLPRALLSERGMDRPGALVHLLFESLPRGGSYTIAEPALGDEEKEGPRREYDPWSMLREPRSREVSDALARIARGGASPVAAPTLVERVP